MTAAILSYVAALVAANLILAKLGPIAAPVIAFVLIGFDLAMRDWLHVRLRPTTMAALIAATGALTFALDPSAGRIAAASAAAFTLAALCDWGAFSALRGSWLWRSVGSNVAGAAVDSIVFPALAFGGLDPAIVGGMFAAKVTGGALWAAALARLRT